MTQDPPLTIKDRILAALAAPFQGPSVAEQLQAHWGLQDQALAQGGVRQLMQDPRVQESGTTLAENFNFLGPIQAYHGSPYVFDKFDMSKVGTGEGAQAYGHGLYFAENPGVAKGYRDKLAAGRKVKAVHYQGQPLYGDQGYVAAPSDPRAQVASYIYMRDGIDGAIQALSKPLTPYLMKKLPPAQLEAQLQERQRLLELLQNERDAFQVVPTDKPGALYNVELRVEPEDLLDWDAPLSQQPEKVRQALRVLGMDQPDVRVTAADTDYWDVHAGGNWQNSIWKEPDGTFHLDTNPDAHFNTFEEAQAAALKDVDTDTYGSELYRKLAAKLAPPEQFDVPGAPRGWGSVQTGFEGQPLASRALHEAGVPGIRYLDQMSRGRDDAEATRNFVLFADELARILGRE
jgi:hypothetical protein